MAAPSVRRGVDALARSSVPAALIVEAKSMLQALHERDLAEKAGAATAPQPQTQQDSTLQERIFRSTKSFTLHLGADVEFPTTDKRQTHTAEHLPTLSHSERKAASDPFQDLPLKAWAERLGERIMPAYEAVQEEQRTAKLHSKASLKPQEPHMPNIPHLLPFTRWAAHNETIKETFIAKNGKERPKARLSWYHPDDTMVPRGWWKLGLLEDLKYYRPFSRN